jgi:hypothetical protein
VVEMVEAAEVNEVPSETRTGSAAGQAVRRSSLSEILAHGWLTGMFRGGLAFVVMAAVGQAVAFAVSVFGEQQVSVAKLGWLYFGWFHHAAVNVAITTRLNFPVEGAPEGPSGAAGLTAGVGLAMMLATFLAIAILYRGGRAVADRAGGTGVARVFHGMKVAVGYAIPPFVLSGLLTVDVPIPENSLVAGSLQMDSWSLSWLVLPLLLAAAAGAAGGLRSGRFEIISREPWGRRAAGAVAGGMRMFALGLVLSFAGLVVLAAVRPSAGRAYFAAISGPPAEQTAVIFAHHVLLLPNQSMWVLVPAMGGCDGLSGGGVHATFLCYSKFPTSVSVSTDGSNGDALTVRTDFETVPTGYFLFLLVPLLSVVLGGRYGVRKRARLRSESIAIGAASGVVFAVLVAVASWLASVSISLSSATGGIPANSSVLIGPGVLIGGLLALVWGVLGGAIGGWLGGREFPPTERLTPPSSFATERS